MFQMRRVAIKTQNVSLKTGTGVKHGYSNLEFVDREYVLINFFVNLINEFQVFECAEFKFKSTKCDLNLKLFNVQI